MGYTLLLPYRTIVDCVCACVRVWAAHGTYSTNYLARVRAVGLPLRVPGKVEGRTEELPSLDSPVPFRQFTVTGYSIEKSIVSNTSLKETSGGGWAVRSAFPVEI